MQEIEILAPAGNLEKMETALRFGADAVYFGLPDFSLRARSNQFTQKDILSAKKICQIVERKFYITMNIYAHNVHLKKIKEQLQWLKNNKINPDGIIIVDPGIIRLVQKYLPEVDIHLSTQANTTNIEAVRFWKERGIKRVILAREITLNEIKEIHQAVPKMELEIFVHGAMCMSYSGRCILSKWMTDRSANLGDCAQPCRWNWNKRNDKNEMKDNCGLYNKRDNRKINLVDDKNRFGMRVEEDRHGTYMFNSYDISLIEHLGKLIEAGITSFKIEGRAKSVYYVAVISRAYKKISRALKSGMEKDRLNAIIKEQVQELNKMSNRGYWTGFVLGDEPPHLFDRAYLPVEWEFVGISAFFSSSITKYPVIKPLKKGKNNKSKKQCVFIHNKLMVGDEVEIITVDKNIKSKIKNIKNNKDKSLESAHGGLGEIFIIEFDQSTPEFFLLRKKVNV